MPKYLTDERLAKLKRLSQLEKQAKKQGITLEELIKQDNNRKQGLRKAVRKKRAIAKRKGVKRPQAQPYQIKTLEDHELLWAKLIAAAKTRAKRHGLEFHLDNPYCMEGIPSHCPILGIPLFPSHGRPTDNSPTIDRIDNSKGYVWGNCVIISYRANALKSNGTAEEHRAIADFMDDHEETISKYSAYCPLEEFGEY